MYASWDQRVSTPKEFLNKKKRRNTTHSRGWQADEESHTKETEQERWEEGQPGFKRRDCIIQLYEKPRLLPTYSTGGVERDADQSQSMKMTGRRQKKEEDVEVYSTEASLWPYGVWGTQHRRKKMTHGTFQSFKDHWSREKNHSVHNLCSTICTWHDNATIIICL